MYEKFTDRARKVMQLANQEAQRFCHEYIDTFHVLIGLLKEGSGTAAAILKDFGLDLRKIRTEVERIVQFPPRDSDYVFEGKLPHSKQCKEMVEFSIDEARKLSHNYVGTEHVLLGLLRGDDNSAIRVVKNLDVNIDSVRSRMLAVLEIERIQRENDQPIKLRPTAVTKISDLYVTGSSGRSGYYCRIETNGDAVEIGFKTHEELLAHLARNASPSVRPEADEPIIK